MGAFCDVFGQTPRLQVLEYFLEGHRIDLPISGILEETELSRATAYAVSAQMLKEQIILPTRKVGNVQLYKLNKSKPEVQLLCKAFRMVLVMVAKEYEEKESEKKELVH